MTRMLVRAATEDDARLASSGGVDVIEAVFDAPHSAAIAAIRAAFPKSLRLRIDDPAPGALDAAVALGADEIAVPHDAVAEAASRLGTAPRLVALLPARGGLERLPALLAGRVSSVTLDSGEADRLIDAVAIDHLDAFACACRAAGLAFGLAGGLETPDVARLLLLQPDLLGFDVALRRHHRAGEALDAQALETARALIPHEAGPQGSDGLAPMDETDHIFVHDFVAHLAIGAYQAEHGVKQRVRFSVDVDVRRLAERPKDMRGVFSYDIIIETIRVLAARPHVTFVETLAEEVAETLLSHPQLTAVSVKVEKLDVIDGSVGIVIRRERQGPRRLMGLV